MNRAVAISSAPPPPSSLPSRQFLLLYSLVAVFATSGVIYGWPSLRRALQHEQEAEDIHVLSESQLSLVFAAGATSSQACHLFFGWARDRYGTRRITLLSLALCGLGLMGLGVSRADDLWGLASSMMLVGLGAGVQLCLLPVAQVFPRRAGLVVALSSGAFQASSLLFWCISLSSTAHGRRWWLQGHAILILVVMLVGYAILPSTPTFVSPEIMQKRADERDALVVVGPNQSQSSSSSSSSLYASSSPAGWFGGVVHWSNTPAVNHDHFGGSRTTSHKSSLLWEQLQSWEYWILVFWFAGSTPPLQYYIGALGFQFEAHSDHTNDDDGGYLSQLFVLLHAGSALVAPLVGWVVDVGGLSVAHVLGASLSALALVVLAVLHTMPASFQIAGLVVYQLGRLWVYNFYFNYVGTRFGYTHYGTLTGAGMLVAAIVGVLQYPMVVQAAQGHGRTVNAVAAAVLMWLLVPFWKDATAATTQGLDPTAATTSSSSAGRGGGGENENLYNLKHETPVNNNNNNNNVSVPPREALENIRQLSERTLQLTTAWDTQALRDEEEERADAAVDSSTTALQQQSPTGGIPGLQPPSTSSSVVQQGGGGAWLCRTTTGGLVLGFLLLFLWFVPQDDLQPDCFTDSTALRAAIEEYLHQKNAERQSLEEQTTNATTTTTSTSMPSIGSWCTHRVTDMSNLFNGLTDFNEDIARWKVSSVTSMEGMFMASSFNQRLEDWDVSKVTSMSEMFQGNTAFNQPLDAWNVSRVHTMYGMFEKSAGFNQPLASWDVSQHLRFVGKMFKEAVVFNQPLATWNVSHVQDLSGMFQDAGAFRQSLCNWTEEHPARITPATDNIFDGTSCPFGWQTAEGSEVSACLRC